MNIRSTDVLIKEFNATVRGLISKLEKKSRSDIEVANLDRLRKRISLLRTTAGESSLISESSPFFIEYSDQIINRDEKFFNSMDVRSEYIKRKGSVNKQDEFIFSLTDSIRNHYNKATQKEKDELYNEVKALFEACVEYQIATSD
jgi:hypothetical protein